MSDTSKTKSPAEPKAATTDITAHHPDLGERTFPAAMWAALEDEKGNRAGWAVKPAKPADLTK